MGDKTEKNLQRLKVEIRGLLRSQEELENAKNDEDAQISWANHVRSLKLSINLIVRIGRDNPANRPKAWKWQNFSSADELISFMVNSRNDIDHPEDERKDDLISGQYCENSLEIEPLGDGRSFAKISPQTHFSMTGCSINGRPVSGMVVPIKSGEVHLAGNIKVVPRPAGFYVKRVTLANGSKVPVPVCSKRGVAFSANEMAHYGLNWLKGPILELLTDEQRAYVDWCL